MQSQNDRTMMKGYRRVAFVEEFCDILKQIHNNEGLHAGVKKTFPWECNICLLHTVSWSFWKHRSRVSFLPRSVVEQYVKLCSACHQRKPQATKLLRRRIVANGLLSRLQV